MHPEVDQYAFLVSPIHKMDPRLKILSLLIVAFSFAWLKTPFFSSIALLFSFSLIIISHLPLGFVIKRLGHIMLFLVPFFFFLPLTVPGETLFSFLRFHVTYQGLQLALLLFLKGIAIVLLIFPMLATQPFHYTIKAIEKLGMPIKLVWMLAFAYRYLFVALGELRNMRLNLRARGFVSKNNFFTLKILGNLVGTILIRSLERTERIQRAMIARGFNGKIEILNSFKAKRVDFFKALVILFIGLFISFGEFFWKR
ncbi:MAG: cobalt ECF transporter T component CbiQ [Deltaproteobacteria bacterium]|nr:cobalt ECF transporter T component CbiQ [Deltaproteobacteria bacterium]RLA88728.1 MAG: cobalt ECF transporter T component CbiQ [Deltaproteobacteria bacterium]